MTVELLHLTREEVEAAIDRDAILIAPTGSVEQHGPHLPLGTDGMIARHLSIRAAERIDGVVAPTMHFGSFSRPKSGGGRSFRASIGLPPITVSGVVEGFLGEALRQGFRRILLVNAHFENADPAFNAVETLVGQVPGSGRGDIEALPAPKPVAVLVNWWELLTDKEVFDIFGDDFPGWPEEHAGVLETSLMDWLEPSLVRADKKVEGGAERKIDYERFPTPSDTLWPTGIGSTALPTSADLGRQVGELVIAKIVAATERDLQRSR